MFKKIGPGVLVAAAFIGPGTITACTLAGVSFGFALLWAMLLSVLATITLQEMSARLGIITQKGLAEVIKGELSNPWIRTAVISIILGAIVIGNAAYEAGNIGGAVLGLEAIFGADGSVYYPYLIGSLAFLLLYFGSYKILEKVFVGLVLVMSLSFVITAMITKPVLSEVVKGLFLPTIPSTSLLTVIALVGTTVVPYNLFLHASLVSEKWNSYKDLKYARRDTYLAIGLGGLVSMAIIVAAAAIPGKQVSSVMDLAQGLEPLYGQWAQYCMGIGLFAAGITSAITAPLAAAFVVNSCFGWKARMKDPRFRAVWMIIMVVGVFSLSLGIRPIEIITFAQVANGMLLPVMAILLLWIVNRTSVMGNYRNSPLQNSFGVLIIILAILLGGMSIFKVFGQL